MNESNGSNVSLPVPVTYVLTAELWIQYLFFYIILEAVAISENLLIAILIIHDKKIKNFFFSLIAGHSLALAFYSSENFTLGIYRISAYFNPSLFTITRLQCHTLHVLVIFCGSLSSVTMFVLASDRLYSLRRTTHYHKYSSHHATFILLFAFVFTVFTKLIPSYTGSVPFSSNILCTTAVAPFTAEVWTYNYGLNLFLMFVSLFMYSILCIVAYVQKRKLTRNQSQNSIVNQQIKHQLVLFNVIFLLIILYCFTVVPYNILLMMSYYFEAKISSKMVVYGACLNIIDTVLDPLALFIQSSELRRAFRNLFSKSNSVASTNSWL